MHTPTKIHSYPGRVILVLQDSEDREALIHGRFEFSKDAIIVLGNYLDQAIEGPSDWSARFATLIANTIRQLADNKNYQTIAMRELQDTIEDATAKLDKLKDKASQMVVRL